MISRLFPKSSHLRLKSNLFTKSPSASVPHGTSSSNFTLRSSFSSHNSSGGGGGGKYASFKWKRLSEVESEAYCPSDLVVEAQKTAIRECAILTMRKYGRTKLLMEIDSKTVADSVSSDLARANKS